MILNKSEEQWRVIDGFNGKYAVSDKGNVKNIKTGRIFAERYDGAGYRAVTLNGKNYNVHRLVALAFIPNPQNLPHINHIDEDKLNNDVKNLEWCTASENVRHSIYKQCCKVKQIDKDGNLIKIWDSFYQIERELGYARQPITKVCKGRQRYAYGYKWLYVDLNSQRIMNRPVTVYKGTELIGTFASATKVSEELGLRFRSVSDCLKGRHATLKGYSFKYAE